MSSCWHVDSLRVCTCSFEWVDGPLTRAVEHGRWVLIDGANLCNPTVLDRLNALLEPEGELFLTERGDVNGSPRSVPPHPNFRLFLTMDPRYDPLACCQVHLPSLRHSEHAPVLNGLWCSASTRCCGCPLASIV